MMKRKFLFAVMTLIAAMWSFNASAQEDITNDYLVNADLSTVNYGWTYYSDAFKYTDWKTDGDVPVVEFYSQWNAGAPVSIAQKDFKFSQTITLPAGDYRIAVNAFYRNGNGDGTNPDKAWIFAGEKKQNVAALTSAGVAAYSGSSDLYKAANAFSRGDFSNAFDFTLNEESTIELGFQGFFNTSLSWCILGPVKLYKYSLEDYLVDYRAKVTEAEALLSQPMSSDAKDELEDKIVDESTLNTSSDVADAISALTTAMNAAHNSIAAYAQLDEALTAAEAFQTAAEANGAVGVATSIADARESYNKGFIVDEDVPTIIDLLKQDMIALAKAQTAAGSDMTPLVTAAAWTCEQGNGPGAYGNATETYLGGDAGYAPGKVIYQHIEGLQPGTYEVQFYGTANHAREGSAYGPGIAQIFANETVEDIDVIDQAACTITDYLRTLTCEVGEDGILEYGLQNIAQGGQWYVTLVKSLTLVQLAADPVELATAINWENNQRVTASDELLLTVTPSNLEENGYTTTEGMKVQYYIIIDSEDNRYFGENIKAPFTGEPISVDFTQVLDSESHPFVIEPSKYYGVIITDIALLDSEDAAIATTEETIQVTVVGASELYAQAKELAADADAVAVGELLAAIDDYEFEFDETALQAAVDKFIEDNKDVEKDETAKVATNGWKNFNGDPAGVCATQFAPAITTYDGRNAQLAEVFEGNGNRTGTIIYQDITGLENGTYKVGFYGNAFSTSGRDGFACTMEDGAEDVAYVFANEEREFIVAHIATSTTENNFRQFDVEVTDGTIRLGMGKAEGKTQSTNWHTMQIYQLTWFATAKEVYAADQTELAALLDKASALAADGNKTNGKEALESAINEGESAMGSNWYNIPELEAIIANLKQAIEDFTEANYFIDFAAGEYYIIDAETDLKIAAGNAWGTHGIVNEAGLDLTLTPNTETRRITIDSRVNNGGSNQFLGTNLYMDSPATEWALDYQDFGFFITDGTQYLNYDENFNLVMSDTPREWIIVSKEGVMAERMEELAEASEENPVDASFLIQDGSFNRNDLRREAWVVENCTNSNLGDGCTETNGNGCAESYHSTFTISQLVQGAPAGKYVFTAQGFYTPESAENAPVFFVNDKTVAFPVQTGSESNMATASASFVAGLYPIDPIEFIVGEDGEFTVGVQGTQTDQWVIWDNFQLTYYGPAEETKYEIHLPDLAGATITTDPEGEAAAGETVTITVAVESDFALESIQVLGATGDPVAEVLITSIAATETETRFKGTFEMPAQEVFIDVTLVEIDPNDYTWLIENPAYLHEGEDGTADYAGWTWSPAPGESGWKYRDYDEPMNLVTYSGNVNFSFEQTIPEVPAGQYRLSVYGFYRAGSAQDEANRVANGDVTHNLNMFAEVGDAIFTQPIMNLYEGAAEEDVTDKGNHCVVNGYTDLFVPDGAVDSRDFFIAGYYRNDLIINVTEAGEVKIGINHPTSMTYDGDYAPIGAWELYRLGDPEVVENQYFETEVEMEPEDWAGITLFDAETINELAEYFGVAAADLEFQLVDAEGNTDVAYNGNPGEKIFWIDLDGNKKNWGNGNKAYIGYDPETPEIFIVQLGCADKEVLHTTVRLAAGDVFAEFKVTVNFAKPASEIAYDDLNVIATDTKEFSFEVGTQYQGATADVDIAAILEALEVETLDDLTIYAVEPDGYLNKSYNLVGSDGWRDNEGTPHGWGVGAYYYVKADFSRESAQIYEVGTMQVDDDHAYINQAQQFSTSFVFVKNNETHDAFELIVNVALVEPDAIEGILADKTGEQKIFDLSGRRIETITKGGMYIINGKKVLVK